MAGHSKYLETAFAQGKRFLSYHVKTSPFFSYLFIFPLHSRFHLLLCILHAGATAFIGLQEGWRHSYRKWIPGFATLSKFCCVASFHVANSVSKRRRRKRRLNILSRRDAQLREKIGPSIEHNNKFGTRHSNAERCSPTHVVRAINVTLLWCPCVQFDVQLGMRLIARPSVRDRS